MAWRIIATSRHVSVTGYFRDSRGPPSSLSWRARRYRKYSAQACEAPSPNDLRSPPLNRFYGSQFHPEKNAFEFDQAWEDSDRVDPALVHGDSAVEAMIYLARTFVSKCRTNPRRWVGSTPTCKLSHEQAALFTATGSDAQWEACYLQ